MKEYKIIRVVNENGIAKYQIHYYIDGQEETIEAYLSSIRVGYVLNDNLPIESDLSGITQEELISISLEEETRKYLKRTQDGIEAYAKISAEFRLAKLSGQISEEAHHYIEEILIPVRNEVLAGQWISGQQKLEAIGSTEIGQQLYDRLHLQISDYIDANY